MPPIQLVPFNDSHLEGAVVLLAARHSTSRRAVATSPSPPRVKRRGRGISTVLTTQTLAEAHAAGYVACLTDWRTPNPRAARLWPHLGFRPIQCHLHRLVDDRIAWAPTFPRLQ